jgi:hypothetical protein
MKNYRTTLKTVSAVLLACNAGFAAAADTQTLAVTATVSGICKFSAASTPLAFGAIDPTSGSNATVSANVKYKCTKGTASAGVTATGGLTRTMTGVAPLAATDTLAYALAISGDTQTGTGFGSGQDLTLAVTGTITPTQFQNAAAGSYSENVTLNITP